MVEKTHYENDVWTLELEGLGFEKEAIELSKMILHCKPPFAVSVRGRWGSGKTSIMRYAMARLASKPTPRGVLEDVMRELTEFLNRLK
jgi:hypothetical protein